MNFTLNIGCKNGRREIFQCGEIWAGLKNYKNKFFKINFSQGANVRFKYDSVKKNLVQILVSGQVFDLKLTAMKKSKVG